MKEKKMSLNRMLQIFALLMCVGLLFAKVKGDQHEKIKVEYGKEALKSQMVSDAFLFEKMANF